MPTNFCGRVAILCEYDYIQSFKPTNIIAMKRVAILCEYDYIQSMICGGAYVNQEKERVAILCEYDYIQSWRSRIAIWMLTSGVAILCEYDYIQSISASPFRWDSFCLVAILCEYDYIQRWADTNNIPIAFSFVAILCEYDYIQRVTPVSKETDGPIKSQYSASTIISKELAISSCTRRRPILVAILCEYDYIQRTNMVGGTTTTMAGRNTLRVRLYPKGTSGNPCLARAPRAKTGADRSFCYAKGQSAVFTEGSHLYRIQLYGLIQLPEHNSFGICRKCI